MVRYVPGRVENEVTGSTRCLHNFLWLNCQEWHLNYDSMLLSVKNATLLKYLNCTETGVVYVCSFVLKDAFRVPAISSAASSDASI